MKKSELNDYGINNPDGAEASRLDVCRQKFDNDDPKHLKENAMSGQKESGRVSETFEEHVNVSEEKSNDNVNIELSSEISSSSSASSAMASASASVGGGIGAIAGVVAATVAAAVIVVTVFVSALAINLSLVMADADRLVFEVVMTGAQEEDFEKPIFAVLTGEDGTYREQEIDPERLTITFDELEKGSEYLVVVKNEDKVFFKKSYCTATESTEKGYIVSALEGTDVFVEVREVALKAGEYYTLVAKDAQGNVVFTQDGVEANFKYHFTVDEPQNLYFSLSVDGRTYAVSRIELPDYDFENGVWAWTDKISGEVVTFTNNEDVEPLVLDATVTFADKRGGESLVLGATVTRKITKATCDKDGSVVYTAKTTYKGKTYSYKKIVVIESEGHTYEGSYEDGVFTYTCSACGDSYSYTEEDENQ